jgi:Protein of unknown function (DUF2786)
MAGERDRLNKVLAVATNPGSYEQEAIAALRKARDFVKTDPSLAHLPPAPPTPAMKGARPHEASLQSKVTNITRFWLPIFLSNLSEQAYGLGLKSKLSCDFSVVPTTVNIRCDGSKKGCDAFEAHLNWLIEHINSQSKKA